MSFESLLPELIQYAPAAISYFQKPKKTAAEQQQEQLLAQQQDYLRQANDPMSPLMQQYTAKNTAVARNNLAQSIQEIVSQQRRNMGMGRSPVIDPERQDEALSRLTAKGYTDIANTSQDQARQNILGMAQGFGSGAASYGGMASNQIARQAQLQEGNVQGAQTIADMISKIMKSRTTGGANVASMPYNQSVQMSVPRGLMGGNDLNSFETA